MFLNKTMLSIIAVKTDQHQGILYMEKVDELINYILKYGQAAHDKLLKGATITFEQRKEMLNELRRGATLEKDMEIKKLYTELAERKRYATILEDKNTELELALKN